MVEFIKVILTGAWDMLSIQYPGFGFTFGAVALGSVAAVVSLKVLGMILGVSFAPGRILGHVAGGNNRKIKVSNARKGDTK